MEQVTAARTPRMRPPLGAVLARLRNVLEAQADALAADDFDGLEQINADRDVLVAALDGYTRADARPGDRALLEQVAALDQRLQEQVRSGLEQVGKELREIHRGRSALVEYRRRGQTLIRNLAYLDLQG
jgi:hypothetical protein